MVGDVVITSVVRVSNIVPPTLSCLVLPPRMGGFCQPERTAVSTKERDYIVYRLDGWNFRDSIREREEFNIKFVMTETVVVSHTITPWLELPVCVCALWGGRVRWAEIFFSHTISRRREGGLPPWDTTRTSSSIVQAPRRTPKTHTVVGGFEGMERTQKKPQPGGGFGVFWGVGGRAHCSVFWGWFGLRRPWRVWAWLLGRVADGVVVGL